MSKKTTKITYDPDADVMSWEVGDTSARIDYANELGDLVVHFSQDGTPVLVEFLNASQNIRNNKASLKTMMEKAEA